MAATSSNTAGIEPRHGAAASSLGAKNSASDGGGSGGTDREARSRDSDSMDRWKSSSDRLALDRSPVPESERFTMLSAERVSVIMGEIHHAQS
jgi:hypothetical protein